jgi:hypothetical protein
MTARPQLDAALKAALEYVIAEAQPLLFAISDGTLDYPSDGALQEQVRGGEGGNGMRAVAVHEGRGST